MNKDFHPGLPGDKMGTHKGSGCYSYCCALGQKVSGYLCFAYYCSCSELGVELFDHLVYPKAARETLVNIWVIESIFYLSQIMKHILPVVPP